MITYIILRENNVYSWDKFKYLFRAFENNGEIRIYQWNEKEDLSAAADDIKDFLSQNITDRWQIILADASRLYNGDVYMDLKQLAEKVPDVHPRYVHIMVTGTGVSASESEFQLPSNCRLFYQQVDTDAKELTSAMIFRAACNVMMLARGDWLTFPLEYEYIYSMVWDINQEQALQYLNGYEQKYLQIKQELDHTVRMFGKEEKWIDYLPVFPEISTELEKQQKLTPMKMVRFPIFAWNGEIEALAWRDRNAEVIKALKKLLKWPVGRWDAAIADNRRFIFMDLGLKAFEERKMTAKVVEELRQKKESCAEAIYEMGVGTQKRLDKINRILTLEVKLENKIKTRMNQESFWRSLFQTVGGCALVLMLFSILVSNVTVNGDRLLKRAVLFQLAVIAGMGLAFLLVIELYLYIQRQRVRRKIQRWLKQLDQQLWNDDRHYSRLLGKTILYKKYSYLELQQENLQRRRMTRRNNLKRHQEHLVLYHNYGMVLSETLKIRIEVPEYCEINFKGFDETPEESGFYDAPSIMDMKTVELKYVGAKFEIPYPFISDLEIRRYRFPYKDKINNVKRGSK